MSTYLTIITTVLVLTQAIRVIQNAIQLQGMKKVRLDNEKIVEMWERLEEAIDRLNETIIFKVKK
jgi:hypothetical protein